MFLGIACYWSQGADNYGNVIEICPKGWQQKKSKWPENKMEI